MATPDGSIVNALGEDHDDIDAPTLPVGFVIAGKYEVKRVLGVGGNGAVYEGEHTEVGHRVAIKVAHHKEDDRGDVMSRFRREAKICGSLRHPHIGQVFDVGTLAEGAPYMVMELQEGRSLADVVDETSLPVAAIIDITRQLLAGLNAAHQAGTVHLDVKPDNVMLVRDHGGEVVVKLVDFGISRRLSEKDPADLQDEAQGFVVGSPDYMPPEQLRGGGIDVRTDIYATGVLLYEGLTARTPFDAPTTTELVDSIMRDPIPPPTTLRADCPPELERVVLKAMAREPGDRYQSADEMSRALAEVRTATRNTSPTNLVRFSEQSPRPRSVTHSRRRRTIDARTLQTVRVRRSAPHEARRLSIWIGVGAFAGMVCVLAVLAWLVNRRDERVHATMTTPVEVAAAPVAVAPPTAAVATPPPAAAAVAPAPVAAAPVAPAAEPVEDAPVAPVAASKPSTHAKSSSPAAKPEPAPVVQYNARAPKRVRMPNAAPAPEPEPAVIVAPKPPPPPEPQQDTALTRAQLKEASTAYARGRVAEARAMYRKIVSVASRDAQAWRGLAVTANQLGDRSESERALRRYLQLRPNAGSPNKILSSLGNGP